MLADLSADDVTEQSRDYWRTSRPVREAGARGRCERPVREADARGGGGTRPRAQHALGKLNARNRKATVAMVGNPKTNGPRIAA